MYKEDFNKFVKGLVEAVDYVKTELMPDFDFDAFNHDTPYEGEEGSNGEYTPRVQTENVVNETVAEAKEVEVVVAPVVVDTTHVDNGSTEEVDKW